MINILKLRKMEKEKSEGLKKTTKPEDEIVSLDEGKVVEESDEKGKDKKKKTPAKSKAKKNATTNKVKATSKNKTEIPKPESVEEKKTEQTSVEDFEVVEDAKIEVQVKNDKVDETHPIAEEKINETPIEEVKEEVLDAEEAFRQKLMEELLAEDFSVEPETEEWPSDIFGNNAAESGTADKKEDSKGKETEVKEDKQKETKAASGDDELPELSPEEQAEVDRKKAETLKKFMSKTSPKKDEEDDEAELNSEITSVSESINTTVVQAQKTDSSISEEQNLSKKAVSEKDKKLENTVQLIGFNLGNEVYGIDINCIREINRITAITLVPNVPEYVQGVINLRGNVIPIINLRTKTKMPKKQFDSNTRVIIIENENTVVGFIVDAVKEVLRIPESIIAPPPAIAVSEASEYIKAVARTESGLIILLDTDKLLDRKDFA